MTIIRFRSPELRERAAAHLAYRRMVFKRLGPGALGVEEAALAMLQERQIEHLQNEAGDMNSSPEEESGAVVAAGIVAAG